MADKEKTVAASVIMSIYNGSELELEKSINSVLTQDFTDYEFIICNDGSLPEYSAQYKTLLRKISDSRIIYIENDKNLGLAYSLNRCISISRGELLIRQDSDDYSLEGRFSETMRVFRTSDYDIISSNITLFDEKNVWGKRDYPELPQKKDFLFAIPFMHGACSLRKSAVERAGGYSTEKAAQRCEDYELFMKMYSLGSTGVNIQKRLYAFQESEAAIKRRSYFEKIQQTKIKAKGFQRLGLYPIGLLYLPKPLIVGLIPQRLLARIKDRVFRRRKVD